MPRERDCSVVDTRLLIYVHPVGLPIWIPETGVENFASYDPIVMSTIMNLFIHGWASAPPRRQPGVQTADGALQGYGSKIVPVAGEEGTRAVARIAR